MANTVKRADIKNGSINSSKIASGSVTADKLAANSIKAKHLSADAITAVQISAADIDAITVAASKISADNISANSIDGSKIKAGTITSDRFDTSALDAVNARITNLDTQTVSALSFKASIASVDSLDANKATIASLNAEKARIDSLTTTKLTATTATINNLIATNINVTNKLTATQVDARIVNAKVVTTDTLNAGVINAIQINGEYAKIVNLNSEIARIEGLTAAKASITNLTSEKARIDQLIAGTITVGKVAAGGVGAGAIAAGVVTSTALSTDFVLAKNVTSPNFNGSISNGVINAGTTGYCLDSKTGTLIVNSLIARDGIISGNYIKIDSDSGFSTKSNGSLSINPDNQTIGVSNGVITVKSIPSSLIVNESTGIDFIGGTNGRAKMSNSSHITYPNDENSRLKFSFPILMIDTLDFVTSPLLINNITANNLKLDIDYSGISNIANTKSVQISFHMLGSSSTSSFFNSGSISGYNSRFVTNVTNPLLPQGTKSYFLPKFNNGDAQLGIINDSTNRYVLLFARVYLFCPNLTSSDYLTMFLPSDPAYSISITANGVVDSFTKLFASYVLPSNYQFTF